MTSDSDNRPNHEEQVAAVRELADELGEDMAQVPDLLLGNSVLVSLDVTVDEASTPVEAVDAVIRRLIYLGTNTFAFRVVDEEGGKAYIVRGGQVVPLSELQDGTS